LISKVGFAYDAPQLLSGDLSGGYQSFLINPEGQKSFSPLSWVRQRIAAALSLAIG